VNGTTVEVGTFLSGVFQGQVDTDNDGEIDDDGDDADSDDLLENETELEATLSGDNGVEGEVEFVIESEGGEVTRILEIEVENATPGQHNILLAGTIIGAIEVDDDGEGEAELSSEDGTLPDNLPPVMAGTAISIEGIASGTFSQSELHAVLSGNTTAIGQASLESEDDETEFQVVVFGGTAGDTLDVTVAGVVVGQITLNSNGNGELEFESDSDESDGAFPANLPTIEAGTTVSVGTLLSGSFDSGLG